MFARLVGISLGLVLALGATVAVNPDSAVAKAVVSVTSSTR